MTIQEPDTQDVHNRGRLIMISLYTLQRFAHFSPQDSISSVGFLTLQGVWETDDRDTIFQKHLLSTPGGPVHLQSPYIC